MFGDMDNIQSLDLSHFDTSALTNSSRMFENATNLKEIDISSFDLTNVTSNSGMFNGCTKLERIYASSKINLDTSGSLSMFSGCTRLVGGNGTIYDAGYVTAARAIPVSRYDVAAGYFTLVDEPNHKHATPTVVKKNTIKPTADNVGVFNWNFANLRYKTTKVTLDGKVYIDNNYWSNTSDATRERNIFLNTRNMELSFTRDFVASSSVGLFVEEPETLVFDSWSKDNSLISSSYNKGKLFRDYFSVDANGTGGDFEGYEYYRDNNNIYLGKDFLDVVFDYGITGAPINPKVQHIAENTERTFIDMPEVLTDINNTKIPGMTFLGFIGQDANTLWQSENTGEYSILDPYYDSYIDNYKLFNYDINTIDATKASDSKIYLYGIYAYKENGVDTLGLRTCGVPSDADCNHVGIIGNHTYMDASDMSKTFIAVEHIEQMLYIATMSYVEHYPANSSVTTNAIGLTRPGYYINKNMTIEDKYNNIFAKGIIAHFNGHEIRHEKTEALFNMEDSFGDYNRLYKKNIYVSENVQVNKVSNVEEDSATTYTRFAAAQDFNYYIKHLINDTVTSYTAEDNYLYYIKWVDKMPVTGEVSAAIDVSENASGAAAPRYTNFSSIPDNAILAWIDDEDSQEYVINLWTKADKVYWPVSMATNMFYNFKELRGIDVSKMAKTNDVNNVRNMFRNCTKLENIDVTSFNWSTMIYSENMFYGCTNLNTIYSDYSWGTNTSLVSTDMFAGCTSLVGENGTKMISTIVDKTYARFDEDDTFGYLTRKNPKVGTNHAKFIGVATAADGYATITMKDNVNKPGISDTYGLRELLIQGFIIKGYGDTTTQDILFKDTSNIYATASNLYLTHIDISENGAGGGLKVIGNKFIEARNLYIDDMILKNFKTDNTGSLPLIGMMNAYAPVYYLRGLTIDNGTFTDEAFSTVIDPGPTTLVPIPYTTKYLRKTLINSVSRKSTIFENVDIENASVSDELLNLTKYSFYDEERFERGNGVYFKGKNIFKGITVGSNANYMIYVDTNVKFIGADSKTTVKENLKRQYVDTSAHNSYVYVSGEMTISGIFEVVDNEFEFNTAPGTVSSAVYYRSPSNKVVVKDGGFSVNGNEAVGPAAASARVRQFHMSYDLSRKADGTRLPNNTHKMVNENTALIDVPEGYKFKASESTLYIYSEDRSGVYNEQCLISTWSILKVEHYNESESTQIISTFFRDDDHNNDPAWINDRRVYKKKRGIVEKAMLGNEYI